LDLLERAHKANTFHFLPYVGELYRNPISAYVASVVGDTTVTAGREDLVNRYFSVLFLAEVNCALDRYVCAIAIIPSQIQRHHGGLVLLIS